MDDPQRTPPPARWAEVLRAVLSSLPGFLPQPPRRPHGSVTRDEIAALFAADLKRGPQRRK